jgi:hypothetical protein
VTGEREEEKGKERKGERRKRNGKVRGGKRKGKPRGFQFCLPKNLEVKDEG